MKKILVILLLFIVNFGFGQSVSAPDPKSFTTNTSAQDASGFSLSGFNSTDVLLCAIGLPSAPSGTTFYISTSTGLTAASGFTLSGNKTKLVFTGTMANINNALTSLKVNTTATAGVVQLSVSATVNPTGYYYNPNNGHFYKPVTIGNTYTGARAASLLTTFKGQTGYLVTITSADEDNFIIANVPQSNIWFACTDEVTEGVWIIDAGPEKGTIIKTQNGQLNGNVQGQYNNWAGGEPNNSGNEDYPVTKWGGGTQWNDLPNNFSCAYVIEYGTWTNPDDQTFTGFYSNSVSHSNGETLRAQFNFNFGTNVDETKFKSKIMTSDDDITYSSNNSLISLNGVGRVDMTTQLDVTQIAGNGIKATINPGQVEYSYVNPNASWLGNGMSRLLIDMRTFGSTTPSSVTNVKILDCYDGPVTYTSHDPNGWAIYTVPSPLTKVTDGTSAYVANIRNVNGWNTDYAFTSNPTFAQNMMYKYHKIAMDISQTDLQSLLGNIVTVGDVYLAFKEYSDRGLLGNESKYFSSGIQFHNADVNEDGIFDERDCYSLLTHLQGTTSLWSSTPVLDDAMKLITSTSYDNMTKLNWNTYTGIKRHRYPFTFTNGTLNAYGVDVSWKGDVNLSHSSQPTGFTLSAADLNNVSQIKSMAVTTNSIGDVEADIMMEKVGENIVATIIINPNGNQIGATQFDVYFDNSVLDFVKVEYKNTTSTNFGKNNGLFISVGSLNTSGGSISNIGYTITFKPKTTIGNILGLVSVKSVETLNTLLNKLNVIVQ